MNVMKRILVGFLTLCMMLTSVQTGSLVKAQAAEEHEHHYTRNTVKEAKCYDPGIDKYTCDVCGDSYYAVTTAEHKWDAGKTTKESGCDTTGELTYTCQNEGCKATKVDTLPALGHTKGEPERVPANCEENGHVIVKCTKCGKVIEDTDLGAVDPAKGVPHVPGEVRVENKKEPTCVAAGSYDSVIRCKVCNAEISRVTITVPANEGGHRNQSGALTEVKPATCTENGISSYVCDVCKKTVYVTVEASHKWELDSTTKEASCTEEGKGTYKCSVCGQTKVDVIPKKGHTWDQGKTIDPTCTDPEMLEKTCTVCGAKEKTKVDNGRPANGHTWGDAQYEAPTCEKNGRYVVKCTVCGAEDPAHTDDLGALDPSKGGHKWGAWKDLKNDPAWRNVTCKADGMQVRERQCSVCGEKQTEKNVVKSDGTQHQYPEVGKGTSLVDANCKTGASGIERFECAVCGKYDYRVVPATHQWQETVVTKKATCYGKGEGTRTCDICGKTEKVEIPATGKHTLVNDVREADCENPAKNIQKCTNAGCKYEKVVSDVKDSKPLGHKPVSAYQEPGCETPGMEVITCSVCKKELNRIEIPQAPSKGGHQPKDKWEEDQNDKDAKEVTCQKDGLKVEVLKCKVCNEVIEKKTTVIPTDGTQHKYVQDAVISPADCKTGTNGIEKVHCTYCNTATYRVLEAKHSWGPETITEGEKTICGKDGKATHVCSVCQKSETYVKKATGKHTMKETVVNATCTEPAYIVKKCENCGYMDASSKKPVEGGKPAEHTLVQRHVDPTCDQNGKVEFYCTTCKQVISTDDLGDKEPAIGGEHEFQDTVVAGNCKNKGYTEHKCKKCGYSYKDTETDVDANNHVRKFVTPYLKNPTCTATGIAKAVCQLCGKDLGYDVVPTTPHVFDGSKAKIVSQPTCTEPGLLESPCANEGCKEKATVELAALGHNYGPEKASEDGQTIYRECTRCGERQIIWSADPCAKGHTNGEPVKENEVAATCQKEGSYEEVIYCTVCKKEVSREKKTTEKLAHTPGEPVQENVVDATCQKEGTFEEVVYCTVCKEEISREKKTGEKLAHTPGEAVKEKEVAATCEADGSYEEVVYCTVCKEEISRKTVKTEKLAHTPGEAVKENEVAATCGQEGSYEEVVYCTVCKKEISRETKKIPAGAHSYGPYEYEFNEAENRWDVYHACTVCGHREKVEY